MKIRTRIILLITTILLLISSLTLVYALLKSTKNIENIEFTMGEFSVELEGSLINDELLALYLELKTHH